MEYNYVYPEVNMYAAQVEARLHQYVERSATSHQTARLQCLLEDGSNVTSHAHQLSRVEIAASIVVYRVSLSVDF